MSRVFQGQNKHFTWTNPTTRNNGAPIGNADINCAEIWKATSPTGTYAIAAQANPVSGVPATSKDILMENAGTFFFKVRVKLNESGGGTSNGDFSDVHMVEVVETANVPASAPTDFG